MKKITLSLAALAAAFTMQAQTTLFEDDFDSYTDFAITNVGNWTLTDVDQQITYGFTGATFQNAGDPMAFIVFNSTATTPPITPTADADWGARSGTKAMTSFASQNQPNNDWMITPAITLGANGNELTFYAKAADNTFSNEVFDVAISTTDTQTSSFTTLLANQVPTALTWQKFTVNLDNYAGQTVYLAINHKGNDQFGFQVDDFKVVEGALSTDDKEFENFNYFVSNNILNLNAKTNIEHAKVFNILGQQVITKTLAAQNAEIDLNNLNDGVYLVQVSIEGQLKSFKVIKK